MKKRMMKICYMMTLAAVLCTSGKIGATGIKSVYAAENEVQGRAATTNGILSSPHFSPFYYYLFCSFFL